MNDFQKRETDLPLRNLGGYTYSTGSNSSGQKLTSALVKVKFVRFKTCGQHDIRKLLNTTTSN